MRKTCLKPLADDEPNKASEYKPKKRIIAECKKEITHGYIFL
jgi:hypothetical protein